MDETKTPATPETNGHVSQSKWDDGFDEERIPQVPDGDKLQLSPEGWEYLADLKWVDQEYNLGHWDQYLGNYIAVYRKQFLGFGPDLLALRERVAREHNVSPSRVLTTYIDPGPFI